MVKNEEEYEIEDDEFEIDPREPKILLIVYTDTQILDSSNIPLEKFPESVSRCETTGFLVKETKDNIFLASQLGAFGPRKWIYAIPKRNIIRKTVLLWKNK